MVRLIAFGFVSFLVVVSAIKVKRGEDVYANCKGDFKPTDAICKKFEFLTNQEAVKKGCVPSRNGTTFYSLKDLPKDPKLDENTIKMASMITNVFEDGSPNFAYAYCEDIHDSRGYTAGYAGFTTGTGDAEIVIEKYTFNSPINFLLAFLPRIKQISLLPHCDRKSRGTILGLGNYCSAWKKEACRSNSRFAKMQLEWVYKNYMLPSVRYAAQSNVTSPLGQAIFYDTIIQHGYQYVEPDINIVRVLVLTGPRQPDESEKSFLTRFLTTRRQLQCCYPDTAWPASASRSADLQTLVDDFEKNKDLKSPVELVKYGVNVTGDTNMLRDEKHCGKGPYALFPLPWLL